MADTQIEMFPSAAKARDAGLEQVRLNSGEWFPTALALFDSYRAKYRGYLMTGEEMRKLLEPTIGPPPNHVNAYGSLVRVMAQRKWIIDTRDRANATTVNSHAREIRIWRVL